MDQAVATTETALIVIDEADVYPAFTSDFSEHLAPHLTKLREIVADWRKTDRDATKKADREEIKEFAWKLTKTRTAIKSHGDAVAKQVKTLPAKVDTNRRILREAIEEMETTVRAPVDAWEAKEKERIDRLVATINELKAMGSPADGRGMPKEASELRLTISELETWSLDTMDEFKNEARLTCAASLARLREALVARERHEADQAELARLRAAAQAQEAKEAADRELREAAQRQQQEAIDKRNREQQQAIEAAELATREAEQRERDAIAEAARIKLQAERDAAEKERQRLQTLHNERVEAEIKKAAEEADERKRAKNRAHRLAVHTGIRDAIETILSRSIDAEVVAVVATAVTDAIRKGEIPCVTIQY